MNGSLLIFDYRVDIINKESSFLYKENKLKLAYLQGHGTGLLTLTGERKTSENSKV
jgi:hypothetical protein